MSDNIHFIFKVIIGAAAIMALVMFVGLIYGIYTTTRHTIPQPGSPLRSSTDARYLRLHTVEHDGHLIIAMYHGGIMHHPDCPCAKQNEGTTLK